MKKILLPLSCLILLHSNLIFAATKCPDAPNNGQCVSVGSYQLFMNEQGSQGPVVVFESGRGDTVDTWQQVMPEVAKFARAVSYDRVNLGASQNLPDTQLPVTAALVAENLHLMLHNAKIAPPYILVGHSNGGLYVQMFARLFPKEVAGVVFVDAASPDQAFADPLPSKTDPDYAEALGFKASQEQIKQAPAFPHVPIIVLTASYHSADPSDADQKLWDGYQDQLARLSPDSMHLYAYGSDHYIQKFQPNLVVDAVYTLVVK